MGRPVSSARHGRRGGDVSAVRHHPSVPTLDDLTPYRRAKLLWRWAHHGLPYVEQLVIDAASGPCRLPRLFFNLSGTTPAFTGSDGRHHLARDELLCGKDAGAGAWSHRKHCEWIEAGDGPRERKGGRVDADVVWGGVEATWTVTRAGPGIDPGLVPKRERCIAGPYELLHCWPPPRARTASVRRMRAALVDLRGPDCHLCGLYPGAVVDHDHETGLVRGLPVRPVQPRPGGVPPRRRLPESRLPERTARGRARPDLPGQRRVADTGVHPPPQDRAARIRPLRRTAYAPRPEVS
ncbi:endonuclease domain-containing protein [Streptomyces sp. NPDC006372]|uniref:endonuclease domain-containing protein n=1 Tax=Streptomyces sp. NPDC006372 TaxID=3155599 RepID=UPI0033A69327